MRQGLPKHGHGHILLLVLHSDTVSASILYVNADMVSICFLKFLYMYTKASHIHLNNLILSAVAFVLHSFFAYAMIMELIYGSEKRIDAALRKAWVGLLF